MNNTSPQGSNELLDKFIFHYKSNQQVYTQLLEEAVNSFIESPQQNLASHLFVTLDDIFRLQETNFFLQQLKESEIFDFYLKYTDFIVNVRRALLRKDRSYRQLFLIEPSPSPSVEAYEGVGYNKLDISPRLNSYAIVS